MQQENNMHGSQINRSEKPRPSARGRAKTRPGRRAREASASKADLRNAVTTFLSNLPLPGTAADQQALFESSKKAFIENDGLDEATATMLAHECVRRVRVSESEMEVQRSFFEQRFLH